MKSFVVVIAAILALATPALARYSPPDVGGPGSSHGSGTRFSSPSSDRD